MYRKSTKQMGVPRGCIHKILFIMRLTTLLLITAIVQVSASSFAQKITLREKNIPLVKVFDKIRSQTGVDFLVSTSILEDAKNISIEVEDAELKDVLEKIFKGQKLDFSIRNKSVVVSKKIPGFLDNALDALENTAKGLFQDIDVRGIVVDENGQPLAGATVKVQKGNKSTKTNLRGEFFLQGVEENTLLEITFIGYTTKEVKASANLGKLPLNLAEAKLEEVTVNAGYYTVTERERTGSIAKVTAKEIENQPVGNVFAAVQGRMAGVNITQNSGVPGAGFDVQIRGRNSLRTRANSETDGNPPLYIVNGVPVGAGLSSRYGGGILPEGNINPLNSINPNDIETIEILKDADATAIYGSRGANGVVLITTKKAKKGNLAFDVNSLYGWSNEMSNLKMMNTEEYLSMRRQAFKNDNVSTYPATAYDVNGTWDPNRYTNWKDELIGNTATFSNTQASLNGGSETTTFLLSAAHTEQSTVFGHGFKYKTNTLSGNISHRSADNRFTFTMSNLLSSLDNNVIVSDITRSSFLLSPNAPALYDSNGKLNWENGSFTNPVADYENTYSNKSLQLLNNLNAEYELLNDFSIKLSGGINYHTFDEWSLRPSTAFNPASGATAANSVSSNSRQDKLSVIVEPQLNWKLKTGAHQVNVLVGGTYQEDASGQGAVQGYGFESNAFIKNIGAAKTKVISDRIDMEYKYVAFYGRINYQLDNKYFLNITGRRDGSSRFGPNKKFANFGAIGLAWIFSDEDFFGDISWLSLGKLRGSIGTTGNDNIGDYQYFDTFATSASIYNGVTALSPTKLYNPDFSWEKTSKLEAAVDLSLFDNRLNFTAAWYHNRSSNQLVGYQLPAITGFTSVVANLAATVQNTGLEFELKSNLLSSKTFSWDAGFNLSIPKNKLISFPGLEGSTYANSYVVGEPVTIVKLYELKGIDPTTGLYSFTDFNNDGRISSPDDRKIIKNAGVKFFGGLNSDLRYKNWNLSFLFQFINQQKRNQNSSLPNPGIMTNLPVRLLDVWSPDNPSGFYMPYRTAPTASHALFQISDAIVSDASFIRLKNVQLAYQIPALHKIFRTAKVYFQGQNLFTQSNFFGPDPEFSSLGFLPPLRTYSFGLQINF